MTLAYIFDHAVCCASAASSGGSLHLTTSQLRTKQSLDCPNHIRRTKSSTKKRIIFRRTVRSMFDGQTFAQLRTGFRDSSSRISYRGLLQKPFPKSGMAARQRRFGIGFGRKAAEVWNRVWPQGSGGLESGMAARQRRFGIGFGRKAAEVWNRVWPQGSGGLESGMAARQRRFGIGFGRKAAEVWNRVWSQASGGLESGFFPSPR